MIRMGFFLLALCVIAVAGKMAVELSRDAMAGPGHCKVPNCICTRFVVYDQDPGNCGYCYHPAATHAADYKLPTVGAWGRCRSKDCRCTTFMPNYDAPTRIYEGRACVCGHPFEVHQFDFSAAHEL